MQGYIIGLRQVKDEDLIVQILTNHKVYTLYRFYGQRHSTINIGFKIDFEIETSIKSSIPRLKDVIQLGFSWILNAKKLYYWQRFIKLFSKHFEDIDTIDKFYFSLLENTVQKISKQETKRALIETYVKLLKYEGRLQTKFVCLLCNQKIDKKISLVRAFLPTHPTCSYAKHMDEYTLSELFSTESTFFLNNEEVDYLWAILLQGF